MISLPYRSPLNPVYLPYGKCCAFHNVVALCMQTLLFNSSIVIAPDLLQSSCHKYNSMISLEFIKKQGRIFKNYGELSAPKKGVLFNGGACDTRPPLNHVLALLKGDYLTNA